MRPARNSRSPDARGAQTVHNRDMEDEPCPHDAGYLSDLRSWAWSRGRTDVVLDLDLHDSAWTFHVEPSRANLVRLAAVLPSGKLDATIERHIRQLVAQGAGQPELTEVKSALRAWCDRLCLAVAADFSESVADFGGAEPAEWS